MRYTGLLKRILPFALTFASGLFIASFFVSVGMPAFGTRHRENRRNEARELQIEVQQLRKEKCNLRREMHEMRMSVGNGVGVMDDLSEFEPVPAPPIAPAAPHRHR